MVGGCSMPSNSLQPLIQIDQANVYLAEIDEEPKRSLVTSILAEMQQFHGADPSGLETPCDLAFVCMALDLLCGIVTEALFWSDEFPRLTVRPVEPERDNTRHTRRIIQAENYCALHSDKWAAAVLMSFLAGAGLMINATKPKLRHVGPPLPAAIPAAPLDYLFLVRALDYALRPDGPVRTMIQEHESGQAKRSQGI
jgi:hypothetical protein